MLEVINNLDELDDVQEIFTNANLDNWNEDNRYRSWIKWSHRSLRRKKILGIFDMPVMAEGKRTKNNSIALNL